MLVMGALQLVFGATDAAAGATVIAASRSTMHRGMHPFGLGAIAAVLQLQNMNKSSTATTEGG